MTRASTEMLADMEEVMVAATGAARMWVVAHMAREVVAARATQWLSYAEWPAQVRVVLEVTAAEPAPVSVEARGLLVG